MIVNGASYYIWTEDTVKHRAKVDEIKGYNAPSESDMEDIVSEIFIRLLERRNAIEDEKYVKGKSKHKSNLLETESDVKLFIMREVDYAFDRYYYHLDKEGSSVDELFGPFIWGSYDEDE